MSEAPPPPESGRRLREHWNAAKEFSINAAVLVFFVGLVYVYYYFKSFGISLIAVAIPLQQYYLFAYGVIVHDALRTCAFAIAMFVLAHGYNWAIDAVAAREQASKSALLRWLVTAFGVAVVILPFPVGFWWAQQTAARDVASRYDLVHETSRRFLTLVPNVTAAKSPEFSDTLNAIDTAGRDGRAVQIAENTDRIFILVGVAPRPGDNVYAKLRDDRVYAINKSLIAVEQTWEN